MSISSQQGQSQAIPSPIRAAGSFHHSAFPAPHNLAAPPSSSSLPSDPPRTNIEFLSQLTHTSLSPLSGHSKDEEVSSSNTIDSLFRNYQGPHRFMEGVEATRNAADPTKHEANVNALRASERVCVCVCVCVQGGERERERESVCVCVCMRGRERESESE